MPNVRVFVKPTGCFGCNKTKELLVRYGVDHEAIDITADPEMLKFVTDVLGFQRVPVVLLDGRTVLDKTGEPINAWSDLRPDLIEQLKEDA